MQDLTKILERHKIVSKFLDCISIDGILNILGIKYNEAKIHTTEYSVNALYVTQQIIDPDVASKIEKAIWEDESNEYFSQGNKVDLLHEPILVVYSRTNGPKYIAAGHTRAKYLLEKEGAYARVKTIAICHPDVEQFIENMEKTIGKKRVSQL